MAAKKDNILTLILSWLKTSDPSRKFRAELDLMFWGAKNSRWVRKYFQRRIFYRYNCDISPSAKIHSSVSFPHPCGVVIGSQAKIDAFCRVYQQVTVGANFNSGNAMAHIGCGTILGSGAKIIGGVQVGEYCIVGANAVVTKDISDRSVVGGVNRLISSHVLSH